MRREKGGWVPEHSAVSRTQSTLPMKDLHFADRCQNDLGEIVAMILLVPLADQ